MTYTVNQLRASGVPEHRLALRRFRREHGDPDGKSLPLKELAAMIGVHHDTLAKYERGRTRTVHGRTHQKITEFLQRWEGR